jgi:5-methylcytosine-specific restriction protein A
MDWTREELGAAVKAYQEMRTLEDDGKKFIKKRIYENLSARFGRSLKAYEYRMQNISYVYELMGRRWIAGLKPKKNVGANVLPIIEELILENESRRGELRVSFDEKVKQIRKRKSLRKPQGETNPPQKKIKTTFYVRDPEVVAWLLENSKGTCESCSGPAPFTKVTGDFYLEVHHLRRLADGGSDTVSNAAAVCPNCHRELHYGDKRDQLLESLYSRVQRLVRE